MAEKIALEFDITADKANMTLGELEKGFEDMKTQLKKVGRGSEEFKQLSTAMAQTTAEIKNIELGFEGLDQEQIASEFGGLAGGIGDVTASLVLMGGENETIEQMGASIEKAMAISMGFKGAIEGGAAGMKLYNNMIKTGKLQTILYSAATKAAAIATKAFNAILKGNPIALLVTAIVAASAALVVFTKNTSKARKEAKMFNDIRKEAAISIVKETAELEVLLAVAKDETVAKGKRQQAIQKLNEISPKYLSNLNLENVNTAEGTRLTDLYVKSLIKASEVKAMQAKIDKLSVELLEDENKEISKGEAAKALLTAWTWGMSEARSNLNENRAAHTQSLKDERRALMDQVIEMTKEGEVAIDVSFTKIDAEKKWSDFRERMEKKWADIMKKGEERKKKLAEERAREREKERERLRLKGIEDAKLLAEFEEEQARIKIQLIQDEGERARAEIDYNSQLELEALEKKGLLTFDAEMLIAQKKHKALADLEKTEDDKRFAAEKAAQDKRDEYDKLLFDAKVANEQEETERKRLQIEEDFRNNIATLEEQGLLTMELEFELTYAKEQAIAAIEDEARKTKDAKDKEQREKNFALATAAIGALSALNDAALATDLLNAAGDEEKKEKIRKASFERQKKLNIAMAAINGAQAVLAGFAQGGLPMAIIAGVTAAAQLAAIVATTYQGGAGAGVETPTQEPRPDGAGDAGGGVQLSPVSNTSTILGNQQVFVTETDITETQNNVSVIEESATF
jgi:hypothetical protein